MSRSRRAFSLILLCGAWMTALGGYFMFVRPAFLPEDLRFMAAGGVLTLLVAATAPATRTSASVLGLAGLVSLVLMSAVNFAIDSDFKWLLLVPALLWAVGVAIVW